MVLAEEEVGPQDLEALEQPAALDVAGDHAEVVVGTGTGTGVEQGDERRLGHLGLEARECPHVGSLVEEGEQQQLDGLGDAGAGHAGEQAQGVEEIGGVLVHPARGEDGAAGRAGHAGEAFDAEVTVRHHLAELWQGLQVGGVGVGLAQDREGRVKAEVVVEQVAAQAERLADQTAAGVTDQVQSGALGQDTGSVEGVLDGGPAQGGVLDGIHAFAVPLAEATPLVGAPQSGERGLGVGEGAVQQDEGRLVGGADRGLAQVAGVELEVVVDLV